MGCCLHDFLLIFAVLNSDCLSLQGFGVCKKLADPAADLFHVRRLNQVASPTRLPLYLVSERPATTTGSVLTPNCCKKL